MKLAFCLFKYFPYGGLQRDFARIAEECVKIGHEVHVYTMEWVGPTLPFLHLHLIKVMGWQNHARIKRFCSKIKNELSAYDLVVGFNKMPGLDVYYAADVPFRPHAAKKHPFLFPLLPRYRAYAALEEAVFKPESWTEILLIAENQQKVFIEAYGTQATRFHILPPGIAKDRIRPGDAEDRRQKLRNRYQLKSNEHLILMVGSGFNTKGVDRAIRALAALPLPIRNRSRLFVIGEDDSKPYLQLASDLKVSSKVNFLGGRSDVADFLLAADLLLHAAYHENTGTVILEALVAGLPVLTGDHCGYAKYVKEACAGQVLSAPYSQQSLNEALFRMLNSPDKSHMQANALAFAKTADIYSLPQKAAAFIDACCLKKAMLPKDIHFIYEPLLPALDTDVPPFDRCMTLRGEVYRDQKRRITQRIQLGGQSYFIKQHFGIGFAETFKNMLQLKKPIFGAENEWYAIQKLESLGVKTPHVFAYGKRGKMGAQQQSFILMEEVKYQTTLEDIAKQDQIAFKDKKTLIKQVAQIARTLHLNGVNHRDFYLCHFLLQENGELCLIDLHRAAVRKQTPLRWVIKDLAALYFSAQVAPLTKRDYLRFIKSYHDDSLRNILKSKHTFWQKVKRRGDTYRDHTL